MKTRKADSRQRHRLIISLGLIGIISLMSSCAPLEQTPGHRPDTLPPAQRQIREEMERSTAEWAYEQGLHALNRDAWDEAVQYFELTIERDAMHLRAYLSLGDVYNMQAKYILAETYYNKVLYYDPHSIPAYSALGAMYRKMGNAHEALGLYRRILELDAENRYAEEQIVAISEELFNLYYEQGLAYQEAGALDRAVIELQKALSISPQLELTVDVGNLYLALQDYMMADGYFQQALSQDPTYFPAVIGAGKVQLALQHYNEAMNYFKQGLQDQPQHRETKNLLEQAQKEKIRRTLPGQYQAIASSEHVTRGDVAALLMVKLNLEHRLPAPTRVVIISDITTHWAKPYIIQAVQFDIMKLPPDRYFLPNEPISKGELAFVLDTVCRKAGNPLPQAGTIIFHDVSPENFWYDAILRTSAAGLISAVSDNRFGINQTLTGQEMQSISAKIKRIIQ